jgi:hypothetical protein
MKSEEDTRNTKLIMTLLVRDEEDIVRENIEFHLRKGVDFIIATDNGSVDGTRDILEEYERKGVLLLIDEQGRDMNQPAWVNRMARIARQQYAADVIFHCDADEFWYPRSGNLRDEILSRSEDILTVELINVPLAKRQGYERYPEDTRFAVVCPIEPTDYQAQTADNNLYLFRYPGKVIFKTKKKLLEVSHGNHRISNEDDSITEGISSDIKIYHYPVRSRKGFLSKVVNSGSSLERNKKQRKSKRGSFHLKRWYEMHKRGLLDREYDKTLLDEGDVKNLLHEGRIEEFDFRQIASGRAERSDVWQFYNRQFEFDIMHLPTTVWYGHGSFVYDLARNLRPDRIVSCYPSFFVFCQAVKDGYLNSQLFAVDTWNRDKDSDFCNEFPLEDVQRIADTFYDTLKVTLLQKTSDQVRDNFEDNSIDILHMSGCDSYQATKDNFEGWIGKVKDSGVVLLHGIAGKREDSDNLKLWEELTKTYFTLAFYHSSGLGVVSKQAENILLIRSRDQVLEDYYALMADNRALKMIPRERDLEIEALKTAVQQKDQEIALMKSSKIWKLRSWCLGGRHLFRSDRKVMPSDK